VWNMVPFGILMPSLRPAKYLPEGDNRTLQIRARRSHELDILRDQYMGDELGPTVRLPRSDYEYRAYCTPEAYARAMTLMIVGGVSRTGVTVPGIDYTKFKPTTDRFNDKQLHATYNRIWSVVFTEHSSTQHQLNYMTDWGKIKPKYGSGTYYNYSSPVLDAEPTKDDHWTTGTRYEDYYSEEPTTVGRHWYDDLDDLEWLGKDDTSPDPDDPWATDPVNVMSDIDLLDAAMEVLDEEIPATSARMTTDQMATCLQVPVRKVREFLRQQDNWTTNNRGHYEVPFLEFPEMAREFYSWVDSKSTGKKASK